MTLEEFQETVNKFFYARAAVINEAQRANPAGAMTPPAVQTMQEILDSVAKVCDRYADVFEDDTDIRFAQAGRWYKQTALKIRAIQL